MGHYKEWRHVLTMFILLVIMGAALIFTVLWKPTHCGRAAAARNIATNEKIKTNNTLNTTKLRIDRVARVVN